MGTTGDPTAAMMGMPMQGLVLNSVTTKSAIRAAKVEVFKRTAQKPGLATFRQCFGTPWEPPSGG